MSETGMQPIICQSCGMPMAATEHFGTQSNGNPSPDYCCFCFREGDFTHSLSMEETIGNSVSHMDGSEKLDGRTLTKDEAALRMHRQLPTLKRWRSHETTHQEYFKAVNRTVDFINEHLSDPINLNDLADIACLSGFHFHRIFKSMLGESPGEYIQRLRLEKAVFRLQTTRLTLAEIATQTGYQSPQALSKAFRKRFGISPSACRMQPSERALSIESPAEAMLTVEPSAFVNKELVSKEPDVKEPAIQGTFIQEPVVREVEARQVITVRVASPHKQTDAFARAWQKLLRFTGANGIPSDGCEYLMLKKDTPTITRPELCRFYVCIAGASPDIHPQGEFGKQTIGGGLYAVFTQKGAYRDLDQLYCFIYRQWIPGSGYELRDVESFERYLNSPDTVPQEELLTEIYIPVRGL